MHITEIRKNFPITEHAIYLDNGSRCPLCKPVLDRQQSFQLFCSESGRDYAAWWRLADDLRGKIARLIHAQAKQVGYASSTTAALNLLAQGYEWKPGDNVIIAASEFPSNVYPWLGLKERNVEIRFLQPQNGWITLSQFQELADKNTRIISVSHIQAANGFKMDLEELGVFCEKKGIVFCVDATQSMGAYPIDVVSSHIDFLATSTYKWLMGSDGLAVFYCSDALQSSLRQVFWGWSGRIDRNEFNQYPLSYPQEAKRFELGNPNFSSLVALDAAMDFRDSVTHETIMKKTCEIVSCFKETLQGIKGLQILGNFDSRHQGALLTLAIENAPMTYHELIKQGFLCALRRDGIRISPYFYNTQEEAETFAKAMRLLLKGGN